MARTNALGAIVTIVLTATAWSCAPVLAAGYPAKLRHWTDVIRISGAVAQ